MRPHIDLQVSHVRMQAALTLSRLCDAGEVQWYPRACLSVLLAERLIGAPLLQENDFAEDVVTDNYLLALATERNKDVRMTLLGALRLEGKRALLAALQRTRDISDEVNGYA